MEKLARLAMLRELVEVAGGHVDGRKKLHKLAYLCQRGGTDLGQQFVFHMYGVYSPSLPGDVQVAESWNYIVERESSTAGKYTIALGSEVPSQTEARAASSQAGFELVSKLAAEPSTTLEVVTTITYLWDAGYRDDRLREKLNDLKGHLSSHFSHSFELVAKYGLTPMGIEPRQV